jgi:intracellular septation protein A
LTPASWQHIGQVLALLFVVLGVMNWLFWKLASIEAWMYFKVFAPLPLLVLALAVVCVILRGPHRVP